MRLSDEDAKWIAAHAADDAVDRVERALDRTLPEGDWEALVDDISEGFHRVLKCVELP